MQGEIKRGMKRVRDKMMRGKRKTGKMMRGKKDR